MIETLALLFLFAIPGPHKRGRGRKTWRLTLENSEVRKQRVLREQRERAKWRRFQRGG